MKIIDGALRCDGCGLRANVIFGMDQALCDKCLNGGLTSIKPLDVREFRSVRELVTAPEDRAREQHIKYLRDSFRMADAAAAERYWWPQLQAAINARSPEQVLRMEREQVLRMEREQVLRMEREKGLR